MDELKEYIRAEQSRGITDDVIFHRLLQEGWSREDIIPLFKDKADPGLTEALDNLQQDRILQAPVSPLTLPPIESRRSWERKYIIISLFLSLLTPAPWAFDEGSWEWVLFGGVGIFFNIFYGLLMDGVSLLMLLVVSLIIAIRASLLYFSLLVVKKATIPLVIRVLPALLVILVSYVAYFIGTGHKDELVVKSINLDGSKSEVISTLDRWYVDYTSSPAETIQISKSEVACLVDCFSVNSSERSRLLLACLGDTNILLYEYYKDGHSALPITNYSVTRTSDGDEIDIFGRRGIYTGSKDPNIFLNLPECNNSYETNCRESISDISCALESSSSLFLKDNPSVFFLRLDDFGEFIHDQRKNFADPGVTKGSPRINTDSQAVLQTTEYKDRHGQLAGQVGAYEFVNSSAAHLVFGKFLSSYEPPSVMGDTYLGRLYRHNDQTYGQNTIYWLSGNRIIYVRQQYDLMNLSTKPSEQFFVDAVSYLVAQFIPEKIDFIHTKPTTPVSLNQNSDGTKHDSLEFISANLGSSFVKQPVEKYTSGIFLSAEEGRLTIEEEVSLEVSPYMSYKENEGDRSFVLSKFSFNDTSHASSIMKKLIAQNKNITAYPSADGHARRTGVSYVDRDNNTLRHIYIYWLSSGSIFLLNTNDREKEEKILSVFEIFSKYFPPEKIE